MNDDTKTNHINMPLTDDEWDNALTRVRVGCDMYVGTTVRVNQTNARPLGCQRFHVLEQPIGLAVGYQTESI
jgi:hypothetical protein